MQRDCAARATCDELRKARRELQARFGGEIGVLCSSFPLFVVSSRPVAFQQDLAPCEPPVLRSRYLTSRSRNVARMSSGTPNKPASSIASAARLSSAGRTVHSATMVSM